MIQGDEGAWKDTAERVDGCGGGARARGVEGVLDAQGCVFQSLFLLTADHRGLTRFGYTSQVDSQICRTAVGISSTMRCVLFTAIPPIAYDIELGSSEYENLVADGLFFTTLQYIVYSPSQIRLRYLLMVKMA